MIYATSDLHGCYEKYMALMQTIDLKKDDTLYVLGDVVDRGEGGIPILLDMMKRENVVPLLGNHDYVAFALLSWLNRDKNAVRNAAFLSAFRPWLADGGKPTAEGFLALEQEEKKKVLFYLSAFGIYEDLECAGKRFLLSHTLPGKEQTRDFTALTQYDFVDANPEYDKEYFPDRYVVTGHTPTLWIEKGCRGIYRKNNHIAIDCGAVFGNKLGCIRLDDLKEYYVE